MRDKFWRWLAWLLPAGLVKWCFVRVAAHATTGKYGDTVVSRLTAIQALQRWSKR